jgi:hypothetical protein
MRHLITTYCNQYKGSFLIDHWLKSLKSNIDLTNIDIMVIDFGLTDEQVSILKKQGVIVNPQIPEGRMSNLHYKYLTEFLNTHEYDQVLYSDCGDLIFQQDISGLFEIAKEKYKAVLEPEFNFKLHRITLGFNDVKKDRLPLIQKELGNRPTLNGGFVLGPAKKMAEIWPIYSSMCNDIQVHGTDQLIINYIFYKNDFEILPRKYNYVTFLNAEKISKDKNDFFVNDEGIIPIVHNAGRYNFARAIADFGYKQGRIKPRIFPAAFRLYYKLIKHLYPG